MIVRSGVYGFGIPVTFLQYGQKLPIRIAGTTHVVSDERYLHIEKGRQQFYLAGHHNAACHFVRLEREAGRIEGDEQFYHYDSILHPDNGLLDQAFDAAPEQTEQMLQMGIVDCAKYVTALTRTFPAMRFIFCYSEQGRMEPSDYQGSKFAGEKPISQVPQPLDQRSIASVDLDLLNVGWDTMARMILLDKVIEQISDCKLIMAFTSPGFMSEKKALEAAQHLVDRLFPD
jgi:hypothetical protein